MPVVLVSMSALCQKRTLAKLYQNLYFDEQTTGDFEASWDPINLKISFIDALPGWFNSLR